MSKKYVRIDAYVHGLDFVGAEIFYDDATTGYTNKHEEYELKKKEFAKQIVDEGKAPTESDALDYLQTKGFFPVLNMDKIIKSIVVYSNGKDDKSVSKADFKEAIVTYKNAPDEHVDDYVEYLDRLHMFAIVKGKVPSKVKVDIRFACKEIEVYTKGTDLTKIEEADFVCARVIYANGTHYNINDFNVYKTKVNEFIDQENKTEEDLKNSKVINIKQVGKVYTSIEISTKGTDLTKVEEADFVTAKAYFEGVPGDSETVTTYSQLKDIMDIFAMQNGMQTPEELIAANKIVIQKEAVIDNDDADSKKKSGIVRKIIKVTSIGVVGALIGRYGGEIYKSITNKEDKKPDKRIETQVPYNDITPYISNTPYVSNTPYSTIAPTPTARPTSTPTIKPTPTATMRPTPTPTVTPTQIPDRLTSIAVRMYNGEHVSDDDLYYFMNEVSRIAYINIPGINDLLSGKSMSGDRGAKIEFYKMFPEDSKEFIVLKVFCLSREDLAYNAFSQRPETVRGALGDYMDSINSYIFDGTAIDYGFDTAYYYELSPSCCYILDVLGAQTLLGDPTYTGRINGQYCNHDQLADEYFELYSGAVELLVNRYGPRK